MAFDEDDSSMMDRLSTEMAAMVPQVFPRSLRDSTLKYASVGQLPSLNGFLTLLEETIGDFYTHHQGPSWKEEKFYEMSEHGLVYAWYETPNQQIIAFVSFLLAVENGEKVLYLYEIHVAPSYQSAHVGSSLLTAFHEFAAYLHRGVTEKLLSNLFDNSATNLTVFSDNSKAFNWYIKMGYTLRSDSPKDKVLRKRTVKPSLYLLTRARD